MLLETNSPVSNVEEVWSSVRVVCRDALSACVEVSSTVTLETVTDVSAFQLFDEMLKFPDLAVVCLLFLKFERRKTGILFENPTERIPVSETHALG